MPLDHIVRRCCRLFVPFLATLPLATPPLAGQASFVTFGSSCEPSLALTVAGVPRIGTSFFVGFSGPFGNCFVGLYGIVYQPVLLLGLSNMQAGGEPLPAAMPTSATGGIACDLLVSPDVAVLLPMGSPPPFGTAVPIPANPQLIGSTLHVQWLLLSERSYFGQLLWLGAKLSNAGTAVIGP